MYSPLVVVALVVCAACSPSLETAPQPATCEDATESAEACVRSIENGELPPSECDADIATAVSLCANGKADGWGSDALCAAGVLHYCSTPACEVPAVVSGDDCQAYVDAEGCATCDYYLCKEAAAQENACGDDGYYLGFGYKYCERISLITGPRLSEVGKVWLADARRCLIEQVEAQVDAQHSCDEVKQIAFDSHPSCYVDAGFCDLPWGDMWSVFITVDPSDVEMRQVFSTGLTCFGNLFP